MVKNLELRMSTYYMLNFDDTNMFHTDNDIKIVCNEVNEDFKNVQEWLNCKKKWLNIIWYSHQEIK